MTGADEIVSVLDEIVGCLLFDEDPAKKLITIPVALRGLAEEIRLLRGAIQVRPPQLCPAPPTLRAVFRQRDNKETFVRVVGLFLAIEEAAYPHLDGYIEDDETPCSQHCNFAGFRFVDEASSSLCAASEQGGAE
ncbi:hypothetical protein [Methylococcus sp. EFPC2]|uniref:hypothetical protein n=1 Tax=Methylococcus sp. EFPC2 TaxID=2812648 RepID=UPI001966D753|nr:hypothetical protein [Methylococcus sp. EFPC2]QSA97123.1 hypothetical protein JWZ97_18345 [Methylococcus sp. EFPC2]